MPHPIGCQPVFARGGVVVLVATALVSVSDEAFSGVADFEQETKKNNEVMSIDPGIFIVTKLSIYSSPQDHLWVGDPVMVNR